MEPQTKSPTPVMDVVTPPAQNAPLHEPPAEPKSPVAADAADKKPPAKPQHPSAHEPKNGVMLAIVATVLIVLALAAMATYAYLKQNHSI